MLALAPAPSAVRVQTGGLATHASSAIPLSADVVGNPVPPAIPPLQLAVTELAFVLLQLSVYVPPTYSGEVTCARMVAAGAMVVIDTVWLALAPAPNAVSVHDGGLEAQAASAVPPKFPFGFSPEPPAIPPSQLAVTEVALVVVHDTEYGAPAFTGAFVTTEIDAGGDADVTVIDVLGEDAPNGDPFVIRH